MPISLVRAVVFLLLVVVQAHAACSMQRAAILPLTLWQQKLFVSVTVNGVDTFFFLDTGAGITTLSKTLSDHLMLARDFDHTADISGVGGMESHLYIARTDDFAVGPVHLAGQSFPVADFAQTMADGSAIGGLIGADILSRFDVDLDVRHRRLGLWRIAGCTDVAPDWPGSSASTTMSMAASRHVSVPVRVDGARLELLIDTGAPTLVLSSRAAARAGATPEMLEENRRMTGRGVNDRAFSGWLHIFSRVEVAGQVFGDVRSVVVAPGRGQTGDGLLGLEFLERARVWLSYSTGMMFLQKSIS